MKSSGSKDFFVWWRMWFGILCVWSNLSEFRAFIGYPWSVSVVSLIINLAGHYSSVLLFSYPSTSMPKPVVLPSSLQGRFYIRTYLNTASEKKTFQNNLYDDLGWGSNYRKYDARVAEMTLQLVTQVGCVQQWSLLDRKVDTKTSDGISFYFKTLATLY